MQCLALQSHGALMAVMFAVVLPASVVIAATFKRPQGSSAWFQVHRALGVSICYPGTQLKLALESVIIAQRPLNPLSLHSVWTMIMHPQAAADLPFADISASSTWVACTQAIAKLPRI